MENFIYERRDILDRFYNTIVLGSEFDFEMNMNNIVYGITSGNRLKTINKRDVPTSTFENQHDYIHDDL